MSTLKIRSRSLDVVEETYRHLHPQGWRVKKRIEIKWRWADMTTAYEVILYQPS